MTNRRRYAQVGVGGRSMMFSKAVFGDFADTCEMVAFCDNNRGRLAARVAWACEQGAAAPGGYAAGDFDRMIGETRPACVIVTTRDSFHDEYIVRAMELGCDVITEKPMTIDAPRCQRILDAQKRTGRKCTVTFNYRYSPVRTQVKDLLMSGVIGDVLSIDFHWLLDTRHGADYFRRWHRKKQNSGGLMVHKATHHFDLVNWWLSDIPAEVFAVGHRKFYTPGQAARYGLTRRAERCLDCPEAGRCPFAIDLRSNAGLRELYLDHEQHDGYLRDRCVFDERIDIEDSMNVLVSYAGGAKMTYSLNAFSPWEGYAVSFNGSKGRLEHCCRESVYINGDGSVPGELLAEGTTVKIFPHFRTGYSVKPREGTGGHGGGDPVMLNDIFGAAPPPDKYLRAADHRSGAYSILPGIAANLSIGEKRPVRISELVAQIDYPDYPPMPSENDPIEIPTPHQKSAVPS